MRLRFSTHTASDPTADYEAAPSGVIDPRPNQIAIAWLVLFAALVLLRSHTFVGPIDHDNGLFLYAGQAAGTGMLPYRDFWDHKPPGVFYLHAVPLAAVPFSLVAVRVFDAFWVSLSATLLFVTSRWLVRIRSAVVTTVFYVLFLSMPDAIRGGGLTEEGGLVFQGLFYLLVLTHPEATRRHAWLAGVCLGCAGQFRQTFILSFPILIVWLWYLRAEQDRPVSWWLKGCLAAFGGLLLPELVVSVWFWLNGAWMDYFEGSYLFNVLYVRRGADGRSWTRLLHSWTAFTLKTGPYLVAPLLAALLLPWMNRMHRRLMLVVVIGYVCDLAATMMSGEFYTHYYVQAAWPMCIALGLITHIGGWALARMWRKPSLTNAWAATVAALTLAVVLGLTARGVQSASGDLKKQYLIATDEEGKWAAQKKIGEAIAVLTRTNDRIQLLGRDPNSCYFLSGRYPASRYYHNTPIFKSKVADDVGSPTRVRFMEDFRENPPALLIVGRGDTNRPWRNLQLVDQHIPELRPLVDSDYIALEKVAGIPDEWWWYGRACRFFVLRSRAEEMGATVSQAGM